MAIEDVGFGALAAVLFGTADFVAKISSDRAGFLRTTFYMQLIGGLFAMAFAFQRLQLLLQYPAMTAAALTLGAINMLGTLSLYKSFELGQLSIVSPLASGYPALNVILAVLVLGESLSGWNALGILLTLLGVIVVSLRHGSDPSLQKTTMLAKGTIYAVAAFVCYGVLFFGFKFVVGVFGSWLPVLLLRVVSIGGVGISLGIASPTKRSSIRKVFHLFAIVAVVDTLANATYLTGITSGEVSIVSSVTGLFSTVTVLLAILLLKERPVKRQVAGITAILVGVFFLGYF